MKKGEKWVKFSTDKKSKAWKAMKHCNTSLYKWIIHFFLYLGDLWCNFTKNHPFFGKCPFPENIILTARARAQDISGNIDPIDLKFSGMVNYLKTNRFTWGIRNLFIFFMKKALCRKCRKCAIKAKSLKTSELRQKGIN